MENFSSASFSANLTRFLNERGWTQRDLAAASGISQPSISRYLAAATEPKIGDVLKISDALGINVDYLLHPERYTAPLKEYAREMDEAKTPDQKKAAMDKLRVRTVALAETSALHEELARERAKGARLKKLLQEALAEL